MSEELRGTKRRLALLAYLYVLDRWRAMESGFKTSCCHHLDINSCPNNVQNGPQQHVRPWPVCQIHRR
eukprot:scaffold329_cov118-Skeletonema_menzelii.AAC.5